MLVEHFQRISPVLPVAGTEHIVVNSFDKGIQHAITFSHQVIDYRWLRDEGLQVAPKQVLVLNEDTSNIRNIHGHFVDVIHLIEELNAVEFPARTCAGFLNMLTAYPVGLFPALEQVGAAVRRFTRISSSVTEVRGEVLIQR